MTTKTFDKNQERCFFCSNITYIYCEDCGRPVCEDCMLIINVDVAGDHNDIVTEEICLCPECDKPKGIFKM